MPGLGLGCGLTFSRAVITPTPTPTPSSAPSIVAATTASSSTTATPALPSGWATDDILLLLIETADEVVTAPAGYSEVSGSPQGTNGGVLGSGPAVTRLSAFWKRAVGNETAPTVADPGNHQMVALIAVRGCPTSGSPFDTSVGTFSATLTTSPTLPEVTTTVANCLVVTALATSVDDIIAQASGWTNANLTGYSEVVDAATNLGNGGAVHAAAGVNATAGSTGTSSVALTNSSGWGALTMAMKPA